MPHNLTDSSTFTSPVPAIADGDAVDQSVNDPLAQSLANRTRFLLDHALDGETSWPVARIVEVWPRLLYSGTGWAAAANAPAVSTATHFDVAYFDINEPLRTGMALTQVGVNVQMGHTDATSTNRMQVRVYKRTGSSDTLIATGVFAPNSTALQTVLTGAITDTIDRGTYCYYVRVDSSVSAGDGGLKDFVYSIDLTFNDPGPRNF